MNDTDERDYAVDLCERLNAAGKSAAILLPSHRAILARHNLTPLADREDA